MTHGPLQDYEAATLGYHCLRHRNTILKSLRNSERCALEAAARLPENSPEQLRQLRQAKRLRSVHDRLLKLTQ